jgi:hypothetical protein
MLIQLLGHIIWIKVSHPKEEISMKMAGPVKGMRHTGELADS